MTASAEGNNFPLGVATGQLLAFLVAFSGTMVELIGSRDSPMFLVAFGYFLIFLVHGCYLTFKGRRSSTPLWKFSVVAGIDTAAAYTSIYALSLTSVTSWSLIQPTNLVVVVPLSGCLLGARYSWRHVMSGLLAIGGLALLLLSDVREERRDAITGDVWALIGSLLYGLNQVLVESLLKDDVSSAELLTLMSGFGVLYATSLSLALGEWWPDLSYPVGVYVATAASTTCAFYATAPFVLRHAGAASLTISLLASSLWSVLGKLLVLGGFHPNILAFVCSFAMIVGGVTSFALSGDPYRQQYTSLEDEDVPVAGLVELPRR